MGEISRYTAGFASLLLLMASVAYGDEVKLYRWVDDEGVVHFGDHIPPEFAEEDRHVVNRFGVRTELIEGKKTEEEMVEDARLAAIREAELRAQAEALMRDRVLLSTYLTVAEIEALRDRRIELMDGQIRVTEIYLNNLRGKLGTLQSEAENYRPYNTDPNAPPIDPNLARELSDTLDSIILYEKTLSGARSKQTELVAKFDADIDRFRELKRLN